MDEVSFALSLAAALFSGAGLLVMRHQLAVAREVARGRGLILIARPSGMVSIVNGVQQPRSVRFGVEAVGLGEWSDLAGWLMDDNGSVVEQLWSAVPRFSSAQGPIRETREIDVEDLTGVHLLVTWIEPKNDGIRSMAVRTRPLRKAVDQLPRTGRGVRLPGRKPQQHPADVVEEFRWYRTHRIRHWAQQQKRWWLPGSGKSGPLGEWRAMPDAHYDATQLPGFPISD